MERAYKESTLPNSDSPWTMHPRMKRHKRSLGCNKVRDTHQRVEEELTQMKGFAADQEVVGWEHN